MSNHQKRGGVAELVGPLLKRLKLAKEQVPENSEMEKIIEQIGIEVVKIKDILDSREKLDKELAGYLAKIERQIDSLMDHQPCVKENSEMERQEDWRPQPIKKRQKNWRLRWKDTEEWMDHHQLPPEIKKRIRPFVQVKWFATRGVEEESILRTLPSDIRRDVKRHLCLDLVRHVPLFSEMDEQMVVAICDRLVSCLCPEGTYVARERDPVNEMLFIIRGTLESNTTNGGRSNFFNSVRLNSGDFCGEELLTWALMPKTHDYIPTSTRTVKALTKVEAFALPAKDLKFVLNQFRHLHSRKLKNTFRSYSHAWRLWAAGFIQAAWHQYKRRKMAERQIDPLMDRQPCVNPNSEMGKDTITEVGQSSNQSHQMDKGSKFQEFRELAGYLAKIERQIDPLMDRQSCIKENSEMERQEDWRLQPIKKRQKDWRQRRRDTEEWMDHHQLPPELKKCIRRFVHVKWFATRGVEEESILHALPSDIRRDVQCHLCLDLVRQVPLFSETDEQMVVAICDRLVSCLCPEGMYVAREGNPVNEMLFIIRGTLESNTTNGGRSNFFNSVRLNSGDFCGEELLTWALMPKTHDYIPTSTRTVKALTKVEAFALPAKDLKFVLNQFRHLHSRKLKNTFRYYSHAWRLWAAGFIQAAWHQYKRQKMAERQIDPLIDRQPCIKPNSEMEKDTITEVGQSSNQSHQMDEGSKFQEFRDSLDKVTRDCLDSLAIFPKNVVLKKRFLTYLWLTFLWWPVVDLERIFSDLMDIHVLIPVHREHNKVSKCFTIEPILHKQLISYHESKRDHNVIFEKMEEDSWCLFMDILLNIDQRYLDSKDIIDTVNNDVYAVELGSWRYTIDVHTGVKQTGSEETKLKDHIEVNQTDFLKKMGKNVHYLSLQGISGIVELPASIGQLEYLWVLNLRACHNLEILPQNSSKLKIEWFRHLEVLDLSECYLLDNMPKWVCELRFLKVLKGFVVGSLRNKKQSCSLGDLSKLKDLRKLSIRFTVDILGPEVFRGFSSLDNLLVLTITWRQNKKIPTYSLPKNIEKLDIRCYPEAEVLSKLQTPGELTKLKRLYIRGGNLTTIPCHDNWNVEILRLRFLKRLAYPTNWEGLKNSFKNLKYVEYVECTKPNNFPNDGHSWRNEE